jgi:hypothetical protein
MKLLLTDPPGKKVVYEMDVPENLALRLVRRDQTVTFQGVQYGFLSRTTERARYAPILPPVELTEDMLEGPASATGQ